MAQGPGKTFSHLSVPLIIKDRARLRGGGERGVQEDYNRSHRVNHSESLFRKASNAIDYWQRKQAERETDNLPSLPQGIPLFLRVEPETDIEFLKNFFNLEIISEFDDGYVIVASQEIELSALLAKLEQFPREISGSASVAKIYDILGPDNHELRLKRILSEALFKAWAELQDDQSYTVELSIECLGSTFIKDPPEQRANESNANFRLRLAPWNEEYHNAVNAWDDLMAEREQSIHRLIAAYNGVIHDSIHEDPIGAMKLPDSFTLRVTISGKGLRDIALNYPYLFEITEPEVIHTPLNSGNVSTEVAQEIRFTPPSTDAPKICIIDSGIQERHPFLVDAIDTQSSRCYIPTKKSTDVGDYVPPGGHGTKVAGAVIYPREVATTGQFQFPCWIQNARVLDENNRLLATLAPSLYLTQIVRDYSALGTRLFNHSISEATPHRLQHMSAWAATMDHLSWQHDILFIQSAGNLPVFAGNQTERLGVHDSLISGVPYPEYLNHDASKISSPGESLQALTVGSINHCDFAQNNLRLLGNVNQPSAFTTTGLGWISDNASPPNINVHPDTCTELLRSTMHGGPLIAKDEAGTSFAAPKVSSIAVAVQKLFPTESSLLYKALIINSAEWPQGQLFDQNKFNILRQIGYGIPDAEKATSNTPHRVTLVAKGHNSVKAKEAHIYQVPIPESLRSPGEDFRIRISVTMTYSARPRRTRRGIKNYQSTWVDWKSSHRGEAFNSFKNRVLHTGDRTQADHDSVIPWIIREQDDYGSINGVRRNNSTVQKDWAELHSYELPDDFCVAVIGHQGWDKHPDATANYGLVISFEAVNNDIEIYSRIEVAIENLIESQQVQAEIQIS
jgi:hypothetical protein